MKWEYLHEETVFHSNLQVKLNERGKYGWELVNVIINKNGEYSLFFKRPKKESEA